MAGDDIVDLATQAEVPVVTEAHELVIWLEHYGDFTLTLSVEFFLDDPHRSTRFS
jgi:hypothetical protein